MNAIEFVKTFGFIEAKNTLDDCIFLEAAFFNCLGFDICVSDLKQILEAFELVEKSGGLKACRKTLKIMDNVNADKNGLIYKPFSEAVNLVEQCQ